MSLLGKVLALLNVFGLIGLTILGLMAYGKRAEWQYANFRHDLAKEGLPIHEKEKDLGGRVKYLDISKQTKADLFPTNPVVTQEEEVKRVQTVLQAKLEAATKQDENSLLLVSFLLPLAIDNAQRERLLAIRAHLADDKNALQESPNKRKQLEQDLAKSYADAVAANKKDATKSIEQAFNDRLVALGGQPRGLFEEAYVKVMKAAPGTPPGKAFSESLTAINTALKNQLDTAFTEVIQGTRTGASTEMNVEDRKDAIAYLLFNFVDAEAGPPAAGAQGPAELYQIPGYKRFITVVGLQQAVRAINRQADTLQRTSREVEIARDNERHAFVEQINPILYQARGSARNNEDLAGQLDREKEKVRVQDVLVKQRELNVKDAKEDLDAQRATMAQKMSDLKKMSDELYDLRVRGTVDSDGVRREGLRDATEKNQERERAIRNLEGWRWLPFAGGKFLVSNE